MKRIHCPTSLCFQFLAPIARRTPLLPRQNPLHYGAHRLLATTTTTDPGSKSEQTTLPCRDPLSSAKLAALHARLNLREQFPLQTLARALIDETADPNPQFNNASLCQLGNQLLGYYASEFIICNYPRLPIEILVAAVTAFVGPKPLRAIGREWGVEDAFEPTAEVDAGLLQFARLPPEIYRANGRLPSSSSLLDNAGPPGPPPKTFNSSSSPQELEEKGIAAEQAMANFVRATFGGVYLHEGISPTRQFFRQHVLSRKLNVDELFNFQQPTRELSRLCARENFEPPVARVESTTGLKSRSPVYVVGVYSGDNKIGEGHGGSLDEARIRAAVNALKGWYLYKPLRPVDLPSKTDGNPNPNAEFRPAMVDAGSVIV